MGGGSEARARLLRYAASRMLVRVARRAVLVTAAAARSLQAYREDSPEFLRQVSRASTRFRTGT